MNRAAAQALRRLPWSAELYQRWRAGGEPPGTGYRLDRLGQALPQWVSAVASARVRRPTSARRRVLVFAYLSWWLEHATALSLLLAALGYQVTLAFLPFRRWTAAVSEFDMRRQIVYLRSILAPAGSQVRIVPLGFGARRDLPPGLETELDRQARLDVQYSLQREEVDEAGEDRSLLELRRSRNRVAAESALGWIERLRTQAVVVPNGSILEFAAVYHAARAAGVPVTTYEFGEQRNRLWLAQDAQVMRQDTADLWGALGSVPLGRAQQQRLAELFRARRGGAVWGDFARRWQSSLSEGAAAARQRLGLDPDRPTALVCTNVVGDSLALDRQVFTRGMADWLRHAVRALARHPEVQVVVRVHPGEMLGAGHPSQEIVRSSLPSLPEGLRVIPPESPVNTYDLIELANFGLVYTSTVGLEMALAGLPVIVAGRTHYRGKGFSLDPATLSEFDRELDALAAAPDRRLRPDQVEMAQRYAYRFFFDYPRAFPWHLIGFWDDLGLRPMEEVLRDDALGSYRSTLEALAGEPIAWGAQTG